MSQDIIHCRYGYITHNNYLFCFEVDKKQTNKQKLTLAYFKVNVIFSSSQSVGGFELIATAITDELTVCLCSELSFKERFLGDESKEPILLYRRKTTATVPINQTDHVQQFVGFLQKNKIEDIKETINNRHYYCYCIKYAKQMESLQNTYKNVLENEIQLYLKQCNYHQN